MTDYSNPSRFPPLSGRTGIEERREAPHEGSGTPAAAFRSLESTQRHLERMLGKPTPAEPECTIVVNGKTLPAGRGFQPVTVFRNN